MLHNNYQIIGNLGQDAKANTHQDQTVYNFSLAVDDSTYKDGVKQERIIWVDCALWTKRNDITWLKKGATLALNGKPSVKTWQANNGETKYGLALMVNEYRILKSAPTTEASAPAQTAMAQATPSAPSTGGADDLPF